MATIPILTGDDAARWLAERARPRLDEEARTTAAAILADVRARGDAALRDHTERLDGVRPERLPVPAEERRRALEGLHATRRRALEAARANIEAVHRAQLRREAPVEVRPGVAVWREFRPIERIGIYVPGGRADYPSSLLMCGVPARVAGCPRIVACSPPGPDGRVSDSVLAAAELLELDAVYAVGGAQAIAALACGTESVSRVDKIVGPGNRWVTAAKEIVYGIVDVDMPAGPSEIVVLADDAAEPHSVAADLISQAEHDPVALAAAVVTDADLGEKIAKEVDRQLERLPTNEVARASLAASAVCVAPDRATALDWVNRLAPEHVQITTRDDEDALARIEHAGSVFLGRQTPVAAGDYATGSNHVLPTAGRARAWGPLSVDDFGRWMAVQRMSADGLAALADTITTLARWEGLEGHARAVEARTAQGAGGAP
jgi:histidinol dehydrogenase